MRSFWIIRKSKDSLWIYQKSNHMTHIDWHSLANITSIAPFNAFGNNFNNRKQTHRTQKKIDSNETKNKSRMSVMIGYCVDSTLLTVFRVSRHVVSYASVCTFSIHCRHFWSYSRQILRLIWIAIFWPLSIKN